MPAPALSVIEGTGARTGRPSAAALTLALRTACAERDDLRDELEATRSERLATAALLVDIARRGQRMVALGGRAVQALLDVERIGHREAIRARAMSGDDAA